jgi:hypothetical protein
LWGWIDKNGTRAEGLHLGDKLSGVCEGACELKGHFSYLADFLRVLRFLAQTPAIFFPAGELDHGQTLQ